MKTRTLIIALTVSVGVFTACTEKKKTEENVEIEMNSEETKAVIEDIDDEAERMRLDSIRQVKEHGHAH